MSVQKIPFHELFNPTLQALHELGGSGRNQEIHDKAVVILELTEEQIAELHKPGQSNQTQIAYRLAWARTWLKKYGLVENSSRGVWALTAKGRSTAEVDGKKVERAVNEMLKQEKQEETAGKSAVSEDSDEDLLEADDSTRELEWRDKLRASLSEMQPSAFERLFQRVLRESGFTQVDVTGRSGDGGIDGIGVMRIGGFLSFRVLFQCKRYKGSIGAGTVRDFRGAMVGRTDKGLIVTTGNYTPAATREATRDGAPEIDLVDGEQLIDKLKELELGVKTEEVVSERVTVNPDFFANI